MKPKKPYLTLRFGVGGVKMTHNGEQEPVTGKEAIPALSSFRNSLPFNESMHANLSGIKEINREVL